MSSINTTCLPKDFDGDGVLESFIVGICTYY